MFSLQRLFGQEDRFFGLLLSCAKEAQNSARVLRPLLHEPANPLHLLGEIHKGSNLEYVRTFNARLQQAEGAADALENTLLQDLYSHRSEPLRVIIIKDLYELLEKAVDRCRDGGNVVSHIVLKNS